MVGVQPHTPLGGLQANNDSPPPPPPKSATHMHAAPTCRAGERQLASRSSSDNCHSQEQQQKAIPHRAREPRTAPQRRHTMLPNSSGSTQRRNMRCIADGCMANMVAVNAAHAEPARTAIAARQACSRRTLKQSATCSG